MLRLYFTKPTDDVIEPVTEDKPRIYINPKNCLHSYIRLVCDSLPKNGKKAIIDFLYCNLCGDSINQNNNQELFLRVLNKLRHESDTKYRPHQEMINRWYELIKDRSRGWNLLRNQLTIFD